MKKNLLYIGPIKDNSMHGLLSNFVLDELIDISDINLSYIPISLDQSTSYEASNSYQDISYYDTVIQYAPINYAVSDYRIRENILIPICGYIDTITIDRLRYSNFAKILVNNKYHLDHFKHAFKNKAIQYRCRLFENKLNKSNKKYNINLYNYTNKFYMISSYINEKYLIEKIITAFLLAFRDSSDNALLLFTSSTEEAAQINKLIEDIIKKLHLINGWSKIIILPFSYSLEELEIIHNTGDIYIQTWLSPYEDGILAKKYNNKILSLSRTKSVPVPNTIDLNTEQTENSPITLSIMEDMLSAIENKPKYFSTDNKLIKDILK